MIYSLQNTDLLTDSVLTYLLTVFIEGILHKVPTQHPYEINTISSPILHMRQLMLLD